ncbi:hypothetical protein SUGI_1481610 [Cryptomeria japonica]|uniref:Uncharacterized protein n=1 Tax=Cryptomeria japonica TaxID=3369 RepID=A0AAD3NTE0_CRYJA|nr:hypothetical protein SUGI_1479600 [Cryptomeria japonica]GLJ58875.1 hypothetical protein SUGI_1481610 [Cryptomeria japonica]
MFSSYPTIRLSVTGTKNRRHSSRAFIARVVRSVFVNGRGISSFSSDAFRLGHGNMRPRLLLTLSHNEKWGRDRVTPSEILARVVKVFECQKVLVSEEPHLAGGSHYHVGILNSTATRYNAARRLRDAFPEFVGAALHVSFHRSWETVLRYVMKGQRVLLSWDAVRGLILNPENHEYPIADHHEMLSKTEKLFEILAAKRSWGEVIREPRLRSALFARYSSTKKFYHDIVRYRSPGEYLAPRKLVSWVLAVSLLSLGIFLMKEQISLHLSPILGLLEGPRAPVQPETAATEVAQQLAAGEQLAPPLNSSTRGGSSANHGDGRR